MALSAPTLSGVTPGINSTDAALRPTVQIVFGGQSLIDPLTWNSTTFALYGPGDVVLESGPGSILNSGISDAPYPLLDGPLQRVKIEGTFGIAVSGTSGMADAESYLGGSGLVLAQFTPDEPLRPNTEYTAVLVGDDAESLIPAGNRRFLGLTSYTSPSGFALSGAGATSGFVEVVHPYSRTIQTNQYSANTGLNDIFTITITSGSSSRGFKYEWSKASSPGTFSAVVSGTTDRHNLGDGLQIDFNGTFASGEVHQLNTYIPLVLAASVTWKFNTGTVESYDAPPSEPGAISVVIDETEGGGFGVETATITSGEQFYVVGSTPSHLQYDVSTGLAYIELEFNKALNSGVYSPSGVNLEITSTPLLGLPTPEAASGITPSRLETSGKYLKIYLP